MRFSTRTDRFRPMVAGTLSVRLALPEWLGLAAAGFALGGAISPGFLGSIAALWIMVLQRYYTRLTYLPDSVAQNPEKLYRDRTLMAITIILAAAVWGLTYVRLPRLASWLGVETVAW